VIDSSSPEVQERLRALLGSRRLAADVVSAGPFPDVEALAAAVDAAVERLDGDDLAEAAEAQPRVPTPEGADRLGAAEQAGLGRGEEGDDAAVARGATVYADRFGRPFLIRPTGRTAEDVLDELQRRLKNDPDEEAAETRRELRELLRARLRTELGPIG